MMGLAARIGAYYTTKPCSIDKAPVPKPNRAERLLQQALRSEVLLLGVQVRPGPG